MSRRFSKNPVVSSTSNKWDYRLRSIVVRSHRAPAPNTVKTYSKHTAEDIAELMENLELSGVRRFRFNTKKLFGNQPNAFRNLLVGVFGGANVEQNINIVQTWYLIQDHFENNLDAQLLRYKANPDVNTPNDHLFSIELFLFFSAWLGRRYSPVFPDGVFNFESVSTRPDVPSAEYKAANVYQAVVGDAELGLSADNAYLKSVEPPPSDEMMKSMCRYNAYESYMTAFELLSESYPNILGYIEPEDIWKYYDLCRGFRNLQNGEHLLQTNLDQYRRWLRILNKVKQLASYILANLLSRRDDDGPLIGDNVNFVEYVCLSVHNGEIYLKSPLRDRTLSDFSAILDNIIAGSSLSGSDKNTLTKKKNSLCNDKKTIPSGAEVLFYKQKIFRDMLINKLVGKKLTLVDAQASSVQYRIYGKKDNKQHKYKIPTYRLLLLQTLYRAISSDYLSKEALMAYRNYQRTPTEQNKRIMQAVDVRISEEMYRLVGCLGDRRTKIKEDFAMAFGHGPAKPTIENGIRNEATEKAFDKQLKEYNGRMGEDLFRIHARIATKPIPADEFATRFLQRLRLAFRAANYLKHANPRKHLWPENKNDPESGLKKTDGISIVALLRDLLCPKEGRLRTTQVIPRASLVDVFKTRLADRVKYKNLYETEDFSFASEEIKVENMQKGCKALYKYFKSTKVNGNKTKPANTFMFLLPGKTEKVGVLADDEKKLKLHTLIFFHSFQFFWQLFDYGAPQNAPLYEPFNDPDMRYAQLCFHEMLHGDKSTHTDEMKEMLSWITLFLKELNDSNLPGFSLGADFFREWASKRNPLLGLNNLSKSPKGKQDFKDILDIFITDPAKDKDADAAKKVSVRNGFFGTFPNPLKGKINKYFADKTDDFSPNDVFTTFKKICYECGTYKPGSGSKDASEKRCMRCVQNHQCDVEGCTNTPISEYITRTGDNTLFKRLATKNKHLQKDWFYCDISSGTHLCWKHGSMFFMKDSRSNVKSRWNFRKDVLKNPAVELLKEYSIVRRHLRETYTKLKWEFVNQDGSVNDDFYTILSNHRENGKASNIASTNKLNEIKDKYAQEKRIYFKIKFGTNILHQGSFLYKHDEPLTDTKFVGLSFRQNPRVATGGYFSPENTQAEFSAFLDGWIYGERFEKIGAKKVINDDGIEEDNAPEPSKRARKEPPVLSNAIILNILTNDRITEEQRQEYADKLSALKDIAEDCDDDDFAAEIEHDQKGNMEVGIDFVPTF